MVKYFCDLCGQELTGFHRNTIAAKYYLGEKERESYNIEICFGCFCVNFEVDKKRTNETKGDTKYWKPKWKSKEQCSDES